MSSIGPRKGGGSGGVGGMRRHAGVGEPLTCFGTTRTAQGHRAAEETAFTLLHTLVHACTVAHAPAIRTVIRKDVEPNIVRITCRFFSFLTNRSE